VVYPLEEEPVVLLSVTDENGESFGVEMTSNEALEIATILRRAVLRPRLQEPPPEKPWVLPTSSDVPTIWRLAQCYVVGGVVVDGEEVVS
jgi:hypothetical protein